MASVDKSFEKFCCEEETRWLEEYMEEGRAFQMDDTGVHVCVLIGRSQQRMKTGNAVGTSLDMRAGKQNVELKWGHKP